MPGRLPGPLWGKLLVAAVIIALSALLILQSGATSTFSSAHEAARHALDRYNPVSIGENREYGGYIYRTSGGRFAYTDPARGDFGHMIFDPPDQVTPASGAQVSVASLQVWTSRLEKLKALAPAVSWVARKFSVRSS